MDNLTHSLAGAVLGQMGLKKKTGLAMPALIIGANLPDIDAACFFWLDGTQHLGFRRGITHGPIAMVILPIILCGILIAYDAWQSKRGKRPESRLPIHKGWLLALAFIGTLSHPALDWLNNYGVRFLEPFSSQWFYGDTMFIIDLWIWLALGLGMFISLRREKKQHIRWYRPALISGVAVLSYISVNMMITADAVSRTENEISQSVDRNQIKQIVASPVPFIFWHREILLGDPNNYYKASYSLFDKGRVLDDSQPIEISKHAPPILDLESLREDNPDLDAFLFWSRMPYHGVISENGEQYGVVGDARFTDPRAAGRFQVKIKLEKDVQFVAK